MPWSQDDFPDSMKSQHVLPHEAGWAVKREGGVASNQKADIIFHDKEGKTQKRWEDL